MPPHFFPHQGAAGEAGVGLRATRWDASDGGGRSRRLPEHLV